MSRQKSEVDDKTVISEFFFRFLYKIGQFELHYRLYFNCGKGIKKNNWKM